jgi:hypothetical protein
MHLVSWLCKPSTYDLPCLFRFISGFGINIKPLFYQTPSTFCFFSLTTYKSASIHALGVSLVFLTIWVLFFVRFLQCLGNIIHASLNNRNKTMNCAPQTYLLFSSIFSWRLYITFRRPCQKYVPTNAKF